LRSGSTIHGKKQHHSPEVQLLVATQQMAFELSPISQQVAFKLPLISKQMAFELPSLSKQTAFKLPPLSKFMEFEPKLLECTLNSKEGTKIMEVLLSNNQVQKQLI